MGANPLFGVAVVLAVVGGLELVDRTSFALMALATRNRPLPTWAGGAAAFLATSAIAVTAGAAFVAALGPGRVGLLRIGGGAFLVGYAVWLYLRKEDVEEAGPLHGTSALAVAFLTIFLLELGDTTMIFEIVFVPTFGPLIVFLGGGAGLVAVAAWDVAVGRHLGHRFPEHRVRQVVVAVLIAVGMATILYGAFPSIV